ncbi:hypothetical protein [Pseudooceanicola spongiae]|jgi:hypothetical protein|uniref:Argininosuccinate lyase n=1 Tax=Pseudooceanicola spongiae TaxID=2613965 RepID=A0A7L9WST8_9RHOB|nr:hypothetical protein [Pseudooceanicola spongiae]QOL82944.1 hypothetical protein F3W81_20165 [Pseudooceanicola spongiae]
MDRKTGLIAAALLLALAGCGVDGSPLPPQPNTLPAPGAGMDISPEIGTGIGVASSQLYGTSI